MEKNVCLVVFVGHSVTSLFCDGWVMNPFLAQAEENSFLFLLFFSCNIRKLVQSEAWNRDGTLDYREFTVQMSVSKIFSTLLSNHQCWEILQVYDLTPTPGKLTLKGQSLYKHDSNSESLCLTMLSVVSTRTSSRTEHWDSDRGDRLYLICSLVLSEKGQDNLETLWWGPQPCDLCLVF